MIKALLSLLQLSDPALPIGAYAHSGGLETYVQAGRVNDPVSARRFVEDILCTNIRYTDAALVSLSHAASAVGDVGVLQELDGLCEAVKLPREMREASRKLGGRLQKIFVQALAVPQLAITHYPVVFGYCAATCHIELQETLTGFYYNAAAGIVTNCVKLIPIGQQEGQRLLFSLQPLIMELTEKSVVPDRDLVGLSCPGLDIRGMQHEKLYSRLYMS
jgi:urease accessory protein